MLYSGNLIIETFIIGTIYYSYRTFYIMCECSLYQNYRDWLSEQNLFIVFDYGIYIRIVQKTIMSKWKCLVLSVQTTYKIKEKSITDELTINLMKEYEILGNHWL